jgi:hypothetical protein
MSAFSPARLPSERRFGFVLAAAFALIGIRWLIGHRNPIVYRGCLIAASILLLLAIIAPRSLAPLNRAWFRLGRILGKIVSPLVMGMIFFGVLTPVAVVTRLFGRDALRLKRREVNSYWIDRGQPGTVPAHSFKNQF